MYAASEANGQCEASLCDLRGHRGRGLTEGLGRFASQSGSGERGKRMGARRKPRRVQILLVRFLLAPLEFSKLANAQPSNFGPLPYFRVAAKQLGVVPSIDAICSVIILMLNLI